MKTRAFASGKRLALVLSAGLALISLGAVAPALAAASISPTLISLGRLDAGRGPGIRVDDVGAFLAFSRDTAQSQRSPNAHHSVCHES